MSETRQDAEIEVWVRDDESAYWAMTYADVSASGNEYSLPLGDVVGAVEFVAPGMGLLAPGDVLQAIEQITVSLPYDNDNNEPPIFFNGAKPIHNDDGRLIAVVYTCATSGAKLTVRTTNL